MAVIILVLQAILEIVLAPHLTTTLFILTPDVVDETALSVISYFVILPVYTIFYWTVSRRWAFFPWQHIRKNH